MHANDQQIDKKQHVIPIFIDDVKYETASGSVSGQFLRDLVPIASDLDLWLEVPGPADDVPIRPDAQYDLKPGSHYYTAPSTINPGAF